MRQNQVELLIRKGKRLPSSMANETLGITPAPQQGNSLCIHLGLFIARVLPRPMRCEHRGKRPWLFAGQVHPTVHEQLLTMAHDTHPNRGLAVPAWGGEKDGLFR